MTERVAPGVVQIDTLLGGHQRLTAGYLLEGPEPVLVETGSQSSVPALLGALEGLGVGAGDLAGVAVTHIHLDHAGGVGDLAEAFPGATVYVHEKGARVYGPQLDDLYGRLTPTPSERIRVLGDGDTVSVGGGRTLTAVDSPGHAKHHLALHDSGSGLLFVGDAVGVLLPDLPGGLRPATPPPDFDLDLAVDSLHRFAERRPEALALAHFGVVPGQPPDVLEEAEAVLRRWSDLARAAWSAGRDVAHALAAAFGDADGAPVFGDEAAARSGDAEVQRRLEILNGIRSNAAGLRRWLETRDGGEGGGAG